MKSEERKKLLEKVKNKDTKQQNVKLPKTTKTADIKPYKKDVYDTYVLWYSIPLAVKNLSQPEREKMNLNELAMKLTTIRTQEQFCKEYDVERHTLNEWKKKTSWDEIDTGIKTWMKMMTANWRLALYRTAIKDGKAPEVKLLEQIINDFSEKQTVKHSGEVYVLPEEEKEEIAKLYERNIHRRRNRKA